MIIDTHCHYNLPPLFDDWSTYWQSAQQKNVIGSMVVGTSITTSRTAAEIAQQIPNFFASVGVHPLDVSQRDSIQDLEELARQPKVLAIGECGLDYFRLTDNQTRDLLIQSQKEILVQQLKIAKRLSLPLIIHLRDSGEQAYWDFLELYTNYGPFATPFILHCISGPKKYVQKCIELGAYVGIAGNVTYKNADHIRELIRSVPKDRVLLETDAPFLPPIPHRGETCEPSMIQLTQQYIETNLGITSSQVIENTVTLFPEFKAII